MAKEIMRRTASDNEYLHKDFHASMNIGLEFLRKNYGKEGVIDYLKTFTKKYHAPLTEGLKKEGLKVLKDYFQKIYEAEKAPCTIEYEEDCMIVKIDECPALKHLREMNVAPSPYYEYSTLTVYETVCEGTPFAFECVEYDRITGKSILKFYRRDKI